MNAYCRKYERIGVGKANGRFQIGRSIARANGKHVFQSGFPGAGDYRVAIRGELLIVQVTVRIDKFQTGNLFEARAYGNVFLEAGKNGKSAVDAGQSCPAT